MLANITAGPWTTTSVRDVCVNHDWHVESRRGSNCNQRVEHLRCLCCGQRRVRVWKTKWSQKRPDREWVKDEAS